MAINQFYSYSWMSEPRSFIQLTWYHARPSDGAQLFFNCKDESKFSLSNPYPVPTCIARGDNDYYYICKNILLIFIAILYPAHDISTLIFSVILYWTSAVATMGTKNVRKILEWKTTCHLYITTTRKTGSLESLTPCRPTCISVILYFFDDFLWRRHVIFL